MPPWNTLAGRAPTDEELSRFAECLRDVDRYAQDYGLRLGIEPINRYEAYLVNTAEQARALADLVDEPNVGVHLDTFHMNIEEKSFSDAVRKAGSKLIHLHVIENDRGIPGSGHLP